LYILSEEVRERPTELDLGLWIFAILTFAFGAFLASITYLTQGHTVRRKI